MWDSVSLPSINLLNKLGLTVQSNLQRLYIQSLILSHSVCLSIGIQNQLTFSPEHSWVNHAQFITFLVVLVTWTFQKISIGNVFGRIQQGGDRVTGLILFMARYARPRSHIPQSILTRVVTGHRSPLLTRSPDTSHGRPASVSHQCPLLSYEENRNVVSHSCGVCWSPHCVPVVTIVCFSSQRLGPQLWALGSQAQGEWTGAGSKAGAGTEPGARSRDGVGGMLLLGNRLIYFLMGARREKQTWVSWSCVWNSTFAGTLNIFYRRKRKCWCLKKINF